MKEKNILAIDAGDMSEDIESEIIDVSQIYAAAVQSVWSGSPVGNIIVQGSCDEDSPTNWSAIDTQAAGGGAGSDLVNLDGIGYRWLRVFYDDTSGTGSLTTRVNIKG